MRTLIATVGTVLLLALARGSTDFNLRGIARVGERPQANAVVWLEAPNAPARTPSQKTVLDQRVVASGEWITGQPFDGTTTDGWHADVAVHRPPMGPLMAVFRAEQLDYDAAAPFALHARRVTAGARVRLPRGLTAQVDVLHQTGGDPEYSNALGAALTYSIRFP